MPPLILHFASGDALFTGTLLVLSTLLLHWSGPVRNWWRTLRTLHGCGWLAIFLSATPLPWPVYGAWLALDLCAWFGRRSSLTTSVAPASARQPRPLVIALMISGSAAIAGYEVSTVFGGREWHKQYERIVVIGDSLSAGAGESTAPWPARLASRGYAMTNLAQAGATTRSALEQAAQIPRARRSVLVIVEIGGNDLLPGQSSEEFGRDLDRLTQSLQHPGRTIALMELPLYPGTNGYGEAQRRIGRQYGASLISKRVLARALTGTGQTTDGLHLSEAGHQWLADWFARRLKPLAD